jgi:hypothetical protein
LAEARATSRATANVAATHAGLIWAIADLLRGDYKRSEYGRVILPLVLLRRLDCAKLLYLVLSKVPEVDLHPDKVSNVEMGYLYEKELPRGRRRETGVRDLKPSAKPQLGVET